MEVIQDNEREEGEIVDDLFEDIISSDEELTMIERIKELEAKNMELEKIENISGNYDYQTTGVRNRPQQDISDIMFVEENPMTLKVKFSRGYNNSLRTDHKLHHRAKRRHRISQSPDHKLHSIKEDTKIRRRKRRKIHAYNTCDRKHKKRSPIPVFATLSSDEYDDEEMCSLNREKLKLAVKRDLKSPFRNGNLIKAAALDDQKIEKNDSDEESIEFVRVDAKKPDLPETIEVQSDDSVSLEEQELRMIALKSAVLKKHLERKKRKESDAKKPYSPTDFVSLINTGPNSVLSINDDSSNSMEISPVTSPEFYTEDCIKQIDMDLANSISNSPVFDYEKNSVHNWKRSEKISLLNNVSGDVTNSVTPIDTKSKTIEPLIDLDPKSDNDDVALQIKNDSSEPLDEEEFALRALLLAKMNSPKLNHKSSGAVANKAEKRLKTEAPTLQCPNVTNGPILIKNQAEADTSIETELLRNFLLDNMKRKTINKTELVLKEAVKRLKNRTAPDDDMLKRDNDSEKNPPYGENISTIDNSREARLFDENFVNGLVTDFQNVNIKAASPILENNTILQNKNENIQCFSKKPSQTSALIKIPIHNLTDVKIPSQVKAVVVDSNTKPPVVTVGSSSSLQSTTSIKPQMVAKSIPKAAHKKINHSVAKKVMTSLPKTVHSSTSANVLNNVIRKNDLLQIKRKATEPITSAALLGIKKPKIDSKIPAAAANIYKSSRLTARKPVNKIIINIGVSETESDDDVFGLNGDNRMVIVDNDYFDNSSPKSLRIESPRDSPIPLQNIPDIKNAQLENSLPATENAIAMDAATDDNNKPELPKLIVINDTFQARLDQLLRAGRAKAETMKQVDPPVETDGSSLRATPLAVRHLPPSSQLEYRRLINRMKLLERQKSAKTSNKFETKGENIEVTITNDRTTESNSNSETNNITPLRSSARIDNCPKETLIKTVLLKNANTSAIETDKVKILESNKTATENNPSQQLSDNNSIDSIENPNLVKDKTDISKEIDRKKTTDSESIKRKNESKVTKKTALKNNENKLLAYFETAYVSKSSNLLKNISTTLDLVRAAKSEKIEKLRVVKEMEILRNKLKNLENQLIDKNKKIAKIYPEITESHKKIVLLRSKCNLLDKKTNELGRTVKGNDYKLDAECIAAIAKKSKELSTELRILKNLKKYDATIDEKSICTDPEGTEQIEVKSIESCVLKNVPTPNLESMSCCENVVENSIDEKKIEGSDTVNCSESQNLESDSQKVIIGPEIVNEASEVSAIESKSSTSLEETQQDNSSLTSKDNNDENVVLGDAMTDQKTHTENFIKYISPIGYACIEKPTNLNGVLCPYQISGQCDDKDCKFEHLC